jgi:hypothetical protein
MKNETFLSWQYGDPEPRQVVKSYFLEEEKII